MSQSCHSGTWDGVSPMTGRLTSSVFSRPVVHSHSDLDLNFCTTNCEAEKLLRVYFRAACLRYFGAGTGGDHRAKKFTNLIYFSRHREVPPIAAICLVVHSV